MLKPQDIVVLLKLVALKQAPWTIASLAQSLRMSASEVHGALARAQKSGLFLPSKRRPNRAALQEFLAHGIRYAFPAERLGTSRGVLTAHSAPPLAHSALVAPEVPYVWPDANGASRGEGIKPLFRSLPAAVQDDALLYKLAALADAARIGGARERRVTAEMFSRELQG
jgi:hypothetical protein